MERSYGRYAFFLFVLGVSRAVPGDLRLSRRQRRSSHLPTQIASRRSAEASSDALTRACVSPSWTRPCRRPSRRCSSRGRPRAPGSARSGSAGSRARWPRVLHHERQQLPEDLLERGEQPLRRGRPQLQLAVRPAPGFRFRPVGSRPDRPSQALPTLTTTLPKFLPSSRPARPCGACSSPSITYSWGFTLPSATRTFILWKKGSNRPAA